MLTLTDHHDEQAQLILETIITLKSGLPTLTFDEKCWQTLNPTVLGMFYVCASLHKLENSLQQTEPHDNLLLELVNLYAAIGQKAIEYFNPHVLAPLRDILITQFNVSFASLLGYYDSNFERIGQEIKTVIRNQYQTMPDLEIHEEKPTCRF